MGELSDKCQTMMGATLSATVGRTVGHVDDPPGGTDRGPKAAFLGAAIDAPRKNIDVFVDEAMVFSVVDGNLLVEFLLEMATLCIQRLAPLFVFEWDGNLEGSFR